MAKGDNAILPLYDDADHLTGAATAAITGGRFVAISGAFQSSPLLNATTVAVDGGNMQIATCGAGAKAIGVAAYDAAATGDKIHVYSGRQVVPCTAGATVAAGAEVESDSTGRAITLASGRSNGIALSAATVGNVVYVRIH